MGERKIELAERSHQKQAWTIQGFNLAGSRPGGRELPSLVTHLDLATASLSIKAKRTTRISDLEQRSRYNRSHGS
jgi:hypothetical protein